jgi:His-Xaa-Ser system protein HxsD
MDERNAFIQIAGGVATLRFQPQLYDEVAIAKAAHEQTGECVVHLEQADGAIIVKLSPRQVLTNLEACAGQLANDALDFHLRGLLQAQTEPIRRLIIAQAFSRANLFEPQLDRATLEEDPMNLRGQDRE